MNVGVFAEGKIEDLVFPVPDLLQEVRHVDFLSLHLYHPWVFQHAPWCGSARAIFLETMHVSEEMLRRI